MEATIILILLIIGTLIFVLPIIALVKASGARRQADELAEQVRSLTLELSLLKRRPAEGATPATAPTQTGNVPSTPAGPTPVVAAPTVLPPVVVAPPPPLPPTPPPVEAFEPPTPPSSEPPRIPLTPTPPPIAPAPALARESAPAPEPPAANFNWEQFVGVKLFAWLGGGALLLTAVFFLKYSFDHGWIPPALRAALGFLAGAGLIVGGLWSIRRNYTVGGQSLTATGIVMLYAVTFACRAYYKFEFFQGPIAAALMVLITAAAFLLAVRLDAQVVAILGLLGGFATPPMLSTGVDNPLGLFGFITLLDLGLLAVVLHRRWNYLALLAALGTVFMQIGWADKFFELEKLPTAAAVLAFFNVVFVGAVYLARRRDRASNWIAAAALVPPAVALCFALYFCSLSAVAARPGWVLGTILVADLALLAVCALHRAFARLSLFAGLATFAVTAVWIATAVNADLLNWALGAVVVLAALHSVFPFVQERLEPGLEARRWSALFPPVALVLLLIPFTQMDDVGWWLWPVVVVLNVFALVVAAATRLLAALAASLVLTLIVLGVAIAQLPSEVASGTSELLLVAGFALFFCTGAVWLLRRFGLPLAGKATDWTAYLPDATAGLPFALLLMLVFKLRQSDPSPIFGVVLLLAVLLWGIAVVARRGSSALVALLGALLVEYCWWAERGALGDKSVALVWFLLFGLGFVAAPFLFRRRVLDLQPPWAAAALALPLHFSIIHKAVMATYPNDVPGLLALACALPPLFGLIVLLRAIPADAPYRLNRLAWFGAATLFFVTLVFPLQFSRHWVTVGWALEGAALLWLFHRIPHPGLRLTGVALLTAVFARLTLNPEVLHYAERSPTPIFNWILLSYGAATLCCFAGARLLAPPRDRVLGCNAPAILATLGTILAFALVNFEIADYFTPAGSWVRMEFSGNFARDMSYTIAWALFALLLLVAGIMRRVRAARYAAIALLGVAFVKLIFHDLARLDQIYRIAAFFVVAVVALAASFLIQRFLRTNPPAQP